MTARIEADAAPEEVEALLAEGPDTLVFAPGVHVNSLVVPRSVRLLGEAGAIVDAGGAGPLISVTDDDLDVVVENLTLRGGHSDGGGGVRLTGFSTLTLKHCTVTRCSAPTNQGGGALALRGTLTLEDCTFTGNLARAGSDLVATGISEVHVHAGTYDGDLIAREGATLRVRDARVAGKIHVRGTTTRAPTVRLDGVTALGGVENDAVLPGVLSEDA